MEVTPKVFRDVQFREKLRGGYHPEDVDEFLEQAAVGVEALYEQLEQANERARRAEQSANEATATDEALKRMLVIAQRTADQAVSEARQESDKLLSESRAQAESILADAEERGRRAYESGLAEGQASMERANEALRQAQQEIEGLRSWVDVHKNHLLAILRDAQSLVENAGLLSEPPQVTVELPPDGPQEGEGEHFLGGGDEDANYAPGHADQSEDATGEWDPHYLQGLDHGEGNAPGVPEAGPEGSYAAAPEAGVAAGGGPGAAVFAQGQAADAGARQVPGTPAMAIDERALDNFFSDQDLREERGLGRFRRRQ